MFNKILEWTADRSLAVAGVALVVVIVLRFEKKLPRVWKRRLIAVDIAFAVAVFLLGALKDHLDAKWKTRLDERLASTRQDLDAANRKLSRVEPRTLTQEQNAIITQRLTHSQLTKIIQIRR